MSGRRSSLDLDYAALSEAILARRRGGPGIRCSNRGGWHSEFDLATWSEMSVLVGKLREFGDLAAAWANVSEPGDFNVSHVHVQGVSLAGVFFVEGTSGDLVLEWPEGEHRVTPRPGDIVLFPSWLPHRVEPCRERRITVAFNLR